VRRRLADLAPVARRASHPTQVDVDVDVTWRDVT
jgi:hypothetical protein